jgi:hypothetical protein
MRGQTPSRDKPTEADSRCWVLWRHGPWLEWEIDRAVLTRCVEQADGRVWRVGTGLGSFSGGSRSDHRIYLRVSDRNPGRLILRSVLSETDMRIDVPIPTVSYLARRILYLNFFFFDAAEVDRPRDGKE